MIRIEYRQNVQKFNKFSYQNVRKISPIDFPSLPKPVAEGKVVNGEQAVRGQFPYQVSIRAFSDRSVSICGGSIISANFILTASHCTKNFKKFEIGFGSPVLQNPLFRIVSFTKVEHEKFDSKLLNHDISIIKLPVKIPFSKNVQPVKLPTKNASFKLPNYFNEEVTVSGFGRTSDTTNQISQTLNSVSLRVISNSECADIFGSKIVTNFVICAKGIVKNHQNTGSCLGDRLKAFLLDKIVVLIYFYL